MSRTDELIEAYATGLRIFYQANLVEANLSRVDLSEANLSEANLTKANLSGANLSGADLSGANLNGSDLNGSDLSGADLSEANLSEANLTKADLSRANLSGANLSGANLSGANLSEIDLSEANLSEANLTKADLSEANLSGANLNGVDLSGANLSGANLSGAKYFEHPEITFNQPSQNRFTIIPIFYATDREKTGNPLPNSFFSGRRGQICFGVTEVSIPGNHKFSKTECPPQWLSKVLRENPTKHMVLLNIEELEERQFQERLREKLTNSSKHDALVFIHGYKTSFKNAAYRTAQIAFDLKFQGVPIFYSWPSEAKTLKYSVDETNVAWTVHHFLEFLKLLLEQVGADTVHIIAHSMGNRLLIDALRSFDINLLAPCSASLRQIIFAAPDIDADTFRQIANNFGNKAERLTLYASSNDKALKLSQTLHGYPRAGDSVPNPIVVQGIDTIDVSEIDTSFLSSGHSYFGDQPSILSDIFTLINQNLPPENRVRLIPKILESSTRYWFFHP